MRILLLTCHTGKGHDSAAAAVAEELALRGHHCESLDALVMVSERLSRGMCSGHVWLYRHGPRLFGWGYRQTLKHPELFQSGGVMRRMFSRAEDRLEEILCSGEYDAVLCTHVFAGVMMTQLRQRGKNPLQTWFLATDYGCSPGVGTLEVDGWLIPDRDLAAEFCARGVPRGRLIATGIPVRQAIIRSEPKAQAKAKEGVSPEKAHIVMMCGSMGCGPMEEVTGFLSGQLENAELTVVCGSNEKLRQRLLRKHAAHPNIHIRGYVENISRLLDSADVMLTKPGGISTTECAVKGIPMVFIHAVAGCETDNLRFFQQMGGAVSAETPRELARISCRLLQDQKRQQEMKQALRNKNYAAAAKTIAELITESQRTCQCG